MVGRDTSHFSRFSSDVKMNAALRVPTNTRTPLMLFPSSPFCLDEGCEPSYVHDRGGRSMVQICAGTGSDLLRNLIQEELVVIWDVGSCCCIYTQKSILM